MWGLEKIQKLTIGRGEDYLILKSKLSQLNLLFSNDVGNVPATLLLGLA